MTWVPQHRIRFERELLHVLTRIAIAVEKLKPPRKPTRLVLRVGQPKPE